VPIEGKMRGRDTERSDEYLKIGQYWHGTLTPLLSPSDGERESGTIAN
jgi:hypothetical protein